ncbi:PTS sugar transporter subunit IIA [Tepidibacillus fermentans]|uniref:PTS system N-acetylgalactosamine-specific IIA component n=1 Tax=Tepidibacillus fermentans TaxID=1281767 RepID=A0A4V2USK5_9BACI|nr:PTS sugar transporter subunit IIA [Tepidibacillus fermentans]TCS81822.1 PTS system N-acetylgalactosamine-specific IIA component [Tepidibacillus fermentans]
MKSIMIISGHGNYATGLKNSIELLAGKNDGLYYIDFTASDTDLTLKEKMSKLVKENKGSQILFICDILGGTPFKVAAELVNDRDNMELVAGCNIGSILEALFQKDTLSISELAEFIVNSSKQSTVKFQKITNFQVESNQELEEGI